LKQQISTKNINPQYLSQYSLSQEQVNAAEAIFQYTKVDVIDTAAANGLNAIVMTVLLFYLRSKVISALYSAAVNGYYDMLDHDLFENVVTTAIAKNNVPLAYELLKTPGSFSITPSILANAVNYGNTNAVKMLLEHGCDFISVKNLYDAVLSNAIHSRQFASATLLFQYCIKV
jgi:hypothetical protein